MPKVNQVYKIILIILKDYHFIKKINCKKFIISVNILLNEVFTYNGESRKH